MLKSEKFNFVNFVQSKQKEIDQNIVIRMFENLKGKVHKANVSGLNSLIKFWNDETLSICNLTCKKIEQKLNYYIFRLLYTVLESEFPR